eukprot:TRINITY_DN17421_c1_g2_i1.p2 TRINITY_DN17421_c1_g2~~TRINITY_DN17421_c1_g2_i1.p2  ORF type:complete len:274 (-),score=45.33 TRINITY_DN17421_c1_g2_i1:207-932(-)
MCDVIVKEAKTQEHFEIFRRLCLQYYEWLGEDLCFQDFDSEMRQLQGSYGAPYGCILLAFVSQENSDAEIPAGIVALRPLKNQSRYTTQILNGKNNINNHQDQQQQQLDNYQQCFSNGNANFVECQNSENTDQKVKNEDETTPENLDKNCSDFKIAEMKRLFCLPEFQGKGIGKLLSKEMIKKGKELGYQKIVLDTLDRLEAANKLYQGLGFERIDSYYHNPLNGVIFWEFDFQKAECTNL